MKLAAPPIIDNYEIERRIAVEVMGLPEQPWGQNTPCPYCNSVGRYCGGRSWCSNCTEWYYHGYKNYRDSFDDAMEVVEKMRADGWSFACTLYEGKLPYASFCKGTAASSKNAEAESLPEAICQAALKAVAVPPLTLE